MLDLNDFEDIPDTEQLEELWVPLNGVTKDGKPIVVVNIYKPDGTIETRFLKHKPA